MPSVTEACAAVLRCAVPGFPLAVTAGEAGRDDDLYVKLAQEAGCGRDEIVAACAQLRQDNMVGLSVSRDDRLLGICRTGDPRQAAVDAAWLIEALWPVTRTHPRQNGVDVIGVPTTFSTVARNLSAHRLDEAVSRLLMVQLLHHNYNVSPLTILCDGDWASSKQAMDLVAALCHIGIVELFGSSRYTSYLVKPRRITDADLSDIALHDPQYNDYRPRVGEGTRVLASA